MPRHVPTPGAIIVVTAEDDRFATARQRALEIAMDREQPVILYDWDAPSLMGEPLPTWWSSDGWEGQFPDRLSVKDLEAAGRAEMAALIVDAERRGVTAFGWLPSDHAPEALAHYVNGQGASVVVIPAELTGLHGLEALLAAAAGPDQVAGERPTADVVIA